MTSPGLRILSELGSRNLPMPHRARRVYRAMRNSGSGGRHDRDSYNAGRFAIVRRALTPRSVALAVFPRARWYGAVRSQEPRVCGRIGSRTRVSFAVGAAQPHV